MKDLYIPFLETEYVNIVVTYGVVVICNEQFLAGFIKLHRNKKHSLECIECLQPRVILCWIPQQQVLFFLSCMLKVNLLWRHRNNCCSIVILCTGNNVLISSVKKSMLLMKISKHMAHFQFQHFTPNLRINGLHSRKCDKWLIRMR